jgi:hypothetical protein
LHSAFASHSRSHRQRACLGRCIAKHDSRISADGIIMNDDAQSSMSPDGSVGTGQPTRKKQKRNKPTLSCLECVERKTKVSECVFAGEAVGAEAVAMMNDVKHDNLMKRRC